ncbi:MAG: 3-keto-5-aminohexanoate cleavage protein [Sneathiellaceae bacterium]
MDQDRQNRETAPIVLAVAPNGARRGKADHAALPLTAAELAETAFACQAAGATMLHLHVRDPQGRHLLDAGAYRDTARAIAARTGDGLLLQLTTEAAGRYRPAEQQALLRALPAAFDGAPLFVSLGLREVDAALRPDGLPEGALAEIFRRAAEDGIKLQVILYDSADLERYLELRQRGLIADPRPALLFVLGRYASTGQSAPADLLPFLGPSLPAGTSWMVCAFGRLEGACGLAAAALGGHARLGFENNLQLADGGAAPDNAALIAQLSGGLALAGRRPATAAEARLILGMPG